MTADLLMSCVVGYIRYRIPTEQSQMDNQDTLATCMVAFSQISVLLEFIFSYNLDKGCPLSRTLDMGIPIKVKRLCVATI